jgi:hypothetical protein
MIDENAPTTAAIPSTLRRRLDERRELLSRSAFVRHLLTTSLDAIA